MAPLKTDGAILARLTPHVENEPGVEVIGAARLYRAASLGMMG